MRLVLTALIFVGGLFFALFGLAFLFEPEVAGAALGLAGRTPQGLATLRAEFLSYFGTIGICMIWGAWKRNGDVLLIPAIMMTLAIAGHLVSAATDGAFEGFVALLLIESVFAVLLLSARNLLPHHTVEEITG